MISASGLIAIDPDPLIEIDKMGRRIGAHLVAGGQQYGLEHGAGGALAIGSAHRDFHERHRQIQFVRNNAYAVQAKIDGSLVQGFQIVQPLLQGGGIAGMGTGHDEDLSLKRNKGRRSEEQTSELQTLMSNSY